MLRICENLIMIENEFIESSLNENDIAILELESIIDERIIFNLINN